MNNADDHLRYPIGPFVPQASYTSQELEAYIKRIETLPARLQTIFNSLTAKQIESTYRPGGWTARQVVHHIADSHSNAYKGEMDADRRNSPHQSL